MPDNRRHKGRSQGLEMLLEGIFGAMGADVGVNPEYKTANDAIDRGFVKLGDEEKAVRSGQQDKPFKAGNIVAKPNAQMMNTDHAARGMDRSAEAKTKLDTEAKMTPILLERAEKTGIISNTQRLALEKELSALSLDEMQKKIPIEAEREKTIGGIKSDQEVKTAGEKEKITTKGAIERGDASTLNAEGLMSNRRQEYDTLTGPAALQSSLTKFQKQSSGNIAAKKGSDLQSNIIDRTADTTVDNAVYSADKFKRNAEADYVNSLLKPMGEGQHLVDVRNNNVVAKGPVDPMSQFLNPQGQPAPSSPQTGQRITLSNGQVVVGRNASPQVTQPPVEQATDIVQQPPARQPFNPYGINAKPITPQQNEPLGGEWILVNGQYVRKPRLQSKVTSIPR